MGRAAPRSRPGTGQAAIPDLTTGSQDTCKRAKEGMVLIQYTQKEWGAKSPNPWPLFTSLRALPSLEQAE